MVFIEVGQWRTQKYRGGGVFILVKLTVGLLLKLLPIFFLPQWRIQGGGEKTNLPLQMGIHPIVITFMRPPTLRTFSFFFVLFA